MEYLMKLEKLCPDNVEFKCNSAVLMLKNGNSHGANILEELTQKNLLNVPAFHFYMDYLIKEQKYAHCEKHLKPFVENNPNDFVALLLRFNLYSHMNLLDEASKVAQIIISLEHGCDNVKNYLAHQIQQFNTRTEAIKEESIIEEGNIKQIVSEIGEQEELVNEPERRFEKSQVIHSDAPKIEEKRTETEPKGPSESNSERTKGNENPYRRDKASLEQKSEGKRNSHDETTKSKKNIGRKI